MKRKRSDAKLVRLKEAVVKAAVANCKEVGVGCNCYFCRAVRAYLKAGGK